MSQSRTFRRNRLAAASPTTARRSGLGLAGSLMLHAAIVAGALFTWQHRLDIVDEAPPVVPVELITIAKTTNIKAEAPRFKPEEQKPLEAPKVEPTPAPPVQASVPKLDVAEPAPAPSEPLIKPKAVAPPIVPQMRPDPPKPAPEKKKEKFDINNVLALLNKQQPKSAAPSKAATGAQARRGVGAQTAMTMDLVDALRNEIAQCWSPPEGAPRASDLVVTFELYLGPDGRVARPPQLDASSAAAAASNTYARAAAEAARRAIYECAPYKLPADRYNDWHDITMSFDPRQMMGQ